MNAIQCYSIAFKFGGYWAEVKGHSRKRYVGGRQKTLKIEKEKIKFFELRGKIETLCPWFRGYYFDLYYHVNRTSPNDYELIVSDDDIMNMLMQYTERNKIEIVIVEELGVDVRPSQDTQVMNGSHVK